MVEEEIEEQMDANEEEQTQSGGGTEDELLREPFPSGPMNP